MTHSEIIASVKNRIFSPIYYLQGEETYYIDLICKTIEDTVLSEIEKDFNQTTLYGRDTDIQTIISYAKRFPMMASHQLIIIKEAQDLKKIDELLSYIENPQPSTILVFCHKYGKLDGRKKVSEKLKKNYVLFESKKLYDNQIAGWIVSHITELGFGIGQKASMILAEYIGNDLSRITNEVQKLLIGAKNGHKISEQDVQDRIGISKDFNVFELQRALGLRDIFKANQIIQYFASDPKNHPLVMIIPILYNYFINLGVIQSLKDKSSRSVASELGINPFFANDFIAAAGRYTNVKIIKIIGYLREYDAKSKGINNQNASNEDLMKELIFKILH
jgi:DNA polymerase-3 subunit delta